ncbi:DNA-directed RNA polymerase V subunit 5A-like isoform X3 [Ananas comosus]|uniref:DNA-directed RNA polymerase V subunit 5A-like isoform X2 n=3 Tax=Ananas comosus TaxID=4615 RepID=A0A6P5FV26_ANACO|nr:DNA-directed RNA polymerase V subunit 5A-like isoform X2 [Ananas comosus]XP_020099834.1 DNA-directed RNA polymerase V subunit 5A-like isoform X3 [Ananas comosus]
MAEAGGGEGEGEGCCLSAMVESGEEGGGVESHRYYLARRTLLEMLADRRYDVSPIPGGAAQTLAEFRAWWLDKPDLDRLSFSAALLSNPSQKVRVIFCGTDPVKVSTIREIYKGLKNESSTRLILVVQSKMTFKSREAIKDIFSSKVEIFQITDLLVNITKHFLIPKHEVLTQEEKNELLKKYSVEDKQLPRMLETDAIARYYGLEKGTVMKVTYDGELTGSHVTYRCIM